MRIYLNTTFSNTFLLSQPNFTPVFSTSSLLGGMGNGHCGQFITFCLCCFFLLTFFLFSNVRSQGGTYPWDAVLQNIIQHDSYHGVQSFMHGLLQDRSPTRPQVLPEKLLLCGLFSVGHRSCQDTAPVWDGVVTASFRARPPVLGLGPPWSALSPLPYSSTGCKWTICITVFFFTG